MIHCTQTRRQWLWQTAAGLSAAALQARPMRAAGTASPVAVARCRTYDPGELIPVMQKMFDQLGGIERLVKGKTVAVKINLTGSPTYRLGYLPLEDTHYTHPARDRRHCAPDGPGRRAAAFASWRARGPPPSRSRSTSCKPTGSRAIS